MSLYFAISFTVFLEMLFLEITTDAFFSEKRTINIKVKAIGFLSAVIILTMDAILLQNSYWIKLMIVFLVDYVYICGFYWARAKDAIASIIFYYSILASIDFIGILILLCIAKVFNHVLLYYGMIYSVKCIEIGIGLLIRKIWKRGNYTQIITKEIRRLMYFSGILIGIGAFIKTFLANYETVPEDMIVLIIGIIYLSDFSILYLLLAAKAELERNSMKDAARQIQTQLEMYKNKQELYIKQGKRIHEYKNQLMTIGHLLEQNQVVQALDYIRSLTGSMIKELDYVCTNHPIADAILNMKKQEALDKKISVNLLCSDLKKISLKEEDIIILFGNMLDNAIEAALRCILDKSIHVHIIQEEKQLVVTVKNTCEQHLMVEKGRIVSTKQDGDAHGYGLAAIQDIVEKYDGSFAMKQTGGYVKATVVIPNP